MSAEEIRPEEIQRIGRWPVRRYIGAGGFSWVFEVEDEKLGQRRALKLLKPEAAEGEGYKRFWREARILAAIDDPHLVRIYELDHDPERKLPYYVMELLTGSDLAKLLKTGAAEGRSVATQRAVQIFLDVLQGLARLHALRPIIVHRDIKPGNIQITADGRAKLLDLGIAHVSRAHDDTVDESALTRNVGFIGTVFYASREQLRVEELGPPSDIFGLGICLFETLEGRHPYSDIEELPTKEYQKVLRYYERLEFAKGELELRFRRTPKPLQGVVRKALAVRPEGRYRDAAEMRVALLRAKAGEKTAAPGGSDWGRRLSRALFATVGLLLLVGVAWLATRGPEVTTRKDRGEQGATERITTPSTKGTVRKPPQPSSTQVASQEGAQQLSKEMAQAESHGWLAPQDVAGFRERFERANRLWTEGTFEEAKSNYDAAVSQLNNTVATRLVEAKADTERARGDAIAKRAERNAPDAWSKAEQELASAQAAGSKPLDALGRHRSAQAQYATAAEAATRALDEARQTRDRVLRAKTALPGRGDCPALPESAAKKACRTGDEELARGDAALDELDSRVAGELYAKAAGLFRSTQRMIVDSDRPEETKTQTNTGAEKAREESGSKSTRSEFEELLGMYREAIESRDLDALLLVWSMDPMSRTLLQGWFATYEELSVRIENVRESWTPDGKQVTLHFREVTSGVSGGETVKLVEGSRVANLVREQGGWRIKGPIRRAGA